MAEPIKDGFFHNGWAWMTHPDWNVGNAIPVFMYEVDGDRFYVPLDPASHGEFAWDDRDPEWEMTVPPMAANLIAAAPAMYEALALAVRQNEHDMLMTGEELRQCRAALALARGEQA